MPAASTCIQYVDYYYCCSSVVVVFMLVTAYLTVMSVHTTRTMVAAFSPGWNPIWMKSDEHAHM